MSALLTAAFLGLVPQVAFPAAPDSALLTELPVVRVQRTGTRVTRSCRLVFPAAVLPSEDQDPAVLLRGDGLLVVCEGELRGAEAGRAPDTYGGIGIAIEGDDVELIDARVSGYRVGVFAEGTRGLVVRGADVSGNRRDRLRSTPEAEDPADWLWPHENDRGEWLERYGAGLAVRDGRGIAIVDSVCRRGQNGIVLERVKGSLVERCDASFLSGWGLALWRSSGNVVRANRFDFCIRGYSHGVYNRGQDSAGILLFEQCSDNLIELNSVTHGGDGIFGFAGREALGEERTHPDGHVRRGCNDNVFRANDLSFAAAHGFELTFSFGTLLQANWLEGNAICGAWLGYGRDSLVMSNAFVGNGESGYGSERGGLNAEHARGLVFRSNRFEDDAVGIRIWTDEDSHLASTPWVRANGRGARANRIEGNAFLSTEPAVELVRAEGTLLDDGIPDQLIRADGASRESWERIGPGAAGEAPEWPRPRSREELRASIAAARQRASRRGATSRPS